MMTVLKGQKTTYKTCISANKTQTSWQSLDTLGNYIAQTPFSLMWEPGLVTHAYSTNSIGVGREDCAEYPIMSSAHHTYSSL